MKLLYVLIPSLALVACAGQHPDSAASPSGPKSDINDGALPDSDDTREPSRVHTYIVNAYVDPNNPRLRHRGHLVDAVEQDEKWNLSSTAPAETDLGPATAADDPNAAPNPYSAEFETELSQQRDQYQQLADLGAKMTAEMGKLQEMAEKSADVISENAELRNRLSELQQEIDALKPATPPVAPDARKPSWWNAFLDLFRPVPQGTPVATAKLAVQTNFVLRPAITNSPPLSVPPAPPAPTNAADESAQVPPPGEMSTNEASQF
jgi:hypothetical protein